MTSETICCPKFKPDLWDDKIFEWKNKKFIKDKVFTFFFIPMNFGKVMKRLDKRVRDADASMPEFMCLSDHTSKWNMDVYLAVDKEIPGIQNVTLSGNFYSKVYEGDFKNTEIWSEDFKNNAISKNLKIENLYMWYTTCPKCAKKYGKNYVAIFSKII